jgi:hypothetical protein
MVTHQVEGSVRVLPHKVPEAQRRGMASRTAPA